MKKILVLLILCNNYVNAQDNVIKLNLLDLTYKKITLNYERVLSDNSSIALNVGFLLPRELPTYITDQVETNENYTSKVNGFSIIPEYRLYFGGEDAPRGFYVSPYLKYTNYSVVVNQINTVYDNNIKGTLNSFGIGFQVGQHWIIEDKISIDWTIFGIGVNTSVLSLAYYSNQPNVDFDDLEQDVLVELSEIPIIGSNAYTESGPGYAKGRVPFVLPSLRTALTVGYAF